MPNRIISAAVHDLRRGAAGFDVTLSDHPLQITATVQRVIDELHDMYSRRSSKSHGRFSDDAANYPTEDHVREYFDGRDPAFLSLTSRLMTTLRLQAQRRPSASGGHVFFSHFEKDQKEFIMIAVVSDRLGARLTRNFDVQDVDHLDIDGFRFAGRINITAWQNGEQRCIGFLKGKGNVSEYFQEFLGCDSTVRERQDTGDLVLALKEFAEAQGLQAEVKERFLERAKLICERSSKARQELKFDAFANELTPDDPEALLRLLNDPDRALNDNFVPHRGALALLTKYKAKTAHWSIELDRQALSAGEIRFNAEDETLTITNLPNDLLEQLREDVVADAAA